MLLDLDGKIKISMQLCVGNVNVSPFENDIIFRSTFSAITIYFHDVLKARTNFKDQSL